MHDHIDAAEFSGCILFLEAQDRCLDVLGPVSTGLAGHLARFFAVDQRQPVIPRQVGQQVADRKGAVGEPLPVNVVQVHLVIVAGMDGDERFVADGHEVTVATLVVDVPAQHVQPAR